VGKVLSFLFGTLSESDIETIQKNINTLAENRYDVVSYGVVTYDVITYDVVTYDVVSNLWRLQFM
jgi:hypothetical protein